MRPIVSIESIVESIKSNEIFKDSLSSSENSSEPDVEIDTISSQTQTRNDNPLSSRIVRAKWLITNNCVHLSKLGCFNVKDEDEEVYLVTLFPNCKCSCVIKENCSHIFAAKMSIGLECSNESKKPITLSKLRNTKRNNKKAGRKYRDN
jgi:hypothetical protein